MKWLATLSKEKQYKWSSAKKSDGEEITFEAWAKLIKDNFERCYYIPENPDDDHKYVVRPDTVNRRGIYKDLFGGSKVYEDYQLRYDLVGIYLTLANLNLAGPTMLSP